MVLCVAECWLSRRDATDGGVQGRRRVALWGVRCGLAVSLLGVSLTYSRGSYLALAVSLVVLSGVLRRLRPLFWLALFCLMLVVLPGTATRVASAGDFGEGSIYNRLRLWEGTCAVIAETPLTGAPAEEVGYLYDAWYQPLSLNAHYYYSLNDLLSLANIHGLPLAGTLLALFLCALCVEARHARQNRLSLGEDWESQIVAFCRQLREKSPKVHDLPLILLGDGENSPQLLAAASDMPPETDICLALYAPSEEELQRLLEGAEKSPHTVLIFTDPEIPIPTEKTTIPILPLPNPLEEEVVDSRLKNLERE